MYYTLKDHQGSLAATVHGNTVERLSYDPWGRRRNTTDFGYDNIAYTFDRGYTLHEHYEEFDLINMNGRLYDPILGRMLSPDIVVQDEQSSQAYNRYSYCFNNPLRFTDPSGYVVEDDWYMDKNGRIVWDDKVTSISTTPACVYCKDGTYYQPLTPMDPSISQIQTARTDFKKASIVIPADRIKSPDYFIEANIRAGSPQSPMLINPKIVDMKWNLKKRVTFNSF